MLCYLAILPSKKLTEDIVKVRDKYEWKGRTEPHITIVSPFTYKGDIDLLVNRIKNATNGIRTQLTNISKLNFAVKNKNSVLFLTLTNQDYFSEIQSNIYNAICDIISNKKENFTPEFHITILNKLPYQTISKVYKEIKNQSFNSEFNVEKIILFVIYNNEKWQKKAVFRLINAK